jgi:hypothetical protein
MAIRFKKLLRTKTLWMTIFTMSLLTDAIQKHDKYSLPYNMSLLMAISIHRHGDRIISNFFFLLNVALNKTKKSIAMDLHILQLTFI